MSHIDDFWRGYEDCEKGVSANKDDTPGYFEGYAFRYEFEQQQSAGENN
jgi:hypothetical protein